METREVILTTLRVAYEKAYESYRRVQAEDAAHGAKAKARVTQAREAFNLALDTFFGSNEEKKVEADRTAFEKWYKSKWPEPVNEQEYLWAIRWYKTGYSDDRVQLAWEAWNYENGSLGDDSPISCEWVKQFGGSWTGDVWCHPIDGYREIRWSRASGRLFVASTDVFASIVRLKADATRSDMRTLCRLVGLTLQTTEERDAV